MKNPGPCMNMRSCWMQGGVRMSVAKRKCAMLKMVLWGCPLGLRFYCRPFIRHTM